MRKLKLLLRNLWLLTSQVKPRGLTWGMSPLNHIWFWRYRRLLGRVSEGQILQASQLFNSCHSSDGFCCSSPSCVCIRKSTTILKLPSWLHIDKLIRGAFEKHPCSSSTPEDSALFGSGCDPRICFSKATDLYHTLKELTPIPSRK